MLVLLKDVLYTYTFPPKSALTPRTKEILALGLVLDEKVLRMSRLLLIIAANISIVDIKPNNYYKTVFSLHLNFVILECRNFTAF